jgi:hypothetical protein
VGVILIVAVLGELFLRTFVGGPSPQTYDAEIGYAYIPGALLYQTKEGVTHLKINSLGLNDKEPATGGDQCRIMVVGDSYTAALQVPQAANFSSVAERLNPRLDVVNAGRDGLFLGDLHKVARRLAPVVRPDLTVYVVSERAIDTDTHLPGLRVSVNRTTGQIADVQMQVEQQEGLKRVFGPVLNRSALATRLSAQLRPMIDDVTVQIAKWRRALSGAEDMNSGEGTPSSTPYSDEQLLTYIFERFGRTGPAALLYINGLNYSPDGTASVASTSLEAEMLAAQAAANAAIPMRDTGASLVRAFARTGKPPFGFNNALLPGGHMNEVGHEAVGEVLVDLVRSLEQQLPARCASP